MIIRKRICNKIPTAQYGNVDFDLTTEDEIHFPSGMKNSEKLEFVRKHGKLMDRIMQQEYAACVSEMEEAIIESIEKFSKVGKSKK